jgi:hypothetical protein
MTRRRRLVAWALVVYGILGLAIVVAGGLTGFEVAGRVEELAAEADGTLLAASRATEAAADSFTSVDGSLVEAQTSATSGAELAREASTTLGELAAAMELSVFGAQPLLPLAGDFAESAELADELGGTLDTVGSSLDATRTDMSRIGDELTTLAEELASLRGTDAVEETDATGPPPLRLFVGLLLAWLAIPALGGLLGGLALLASQDRPPVTV